MSNDQIDWLIIKGLYGLLGSILIYLLVHFVKQWNVNSKKSRLLDLEIKEKKTREDIAKKSIDTLIDDANKANGSGRGDRGSL